VSLIPILEAEEFLETIKRTYPLYRGLSEEDLNEAAFATLPGSGAGGEWFVSQSS
jgi:galactokinase